MAKTKSVSFFAAVVLLATGFVYFALAWTEPSQPPPGGNVPAPINVGSAAQTKSGDLTVQGTGSFLNNLSVGSDNWNVGGWAAPGPSARVISGYYGGYGIQKLNARASAFSAIAGANPGSSFSVIMVPWDGTTANLDTLCQNKINTYWHAQAAVKGNYFSQSFDGTDFFSYSTVLKSQAEFDTYKSTGTQWWIGCSTLSAWSKPTIGGYWTGSGNNIYNNNAGNVGIGTTGPGAKLQVAADSGAVFQAGTAAQVLFQVTSNGDKHFYNTSGTENIRITNTGNVGIGTTGPNAKLEVFGGEIYLFNNGNNPRFVIGDNVGAGGHGGIKWDSTNDQIRLWTQTGGDTVTITESGNVGIGTPSPSYKLDVNGTLRAGQTYLSNSDIYFTNTTHNHTGIGNTAGYAAIENANNYNTLMILGRAGTSVGRSVSVWDYLTVNGSQRITGSLTVNGGGSFGQPITVGVPTAASHAATKSYVDSAVSGGTGIAANSYACSADGTCETQNISASGNLTVTGSAQAVKFDGAYTPRYQTWASQGTGAGGAAIYNDNGSYKALMVVGSDQGQGYARWVRVWDSLWANTRIDAPIYYDSSNTGYYVDPASTSRLNTITVGGGLTVSGGAVLGETTSGHYYFKGVGGDSGQANAYYGIYQEAGAWTHPYPDLRIQYHTGIKYSAYYAYGGHRFYTNYDGTGNPYGLAFSVGEGDHNTRVYNNLYVSGGGSFANPVSVGVPTAASHAATKSYVDSAVSGGTGIAANSYACSADGTCETNVLSVSGDAYTTGNIYQNNTKVLAAKNSAGAYENWMWPRWSDNMMYTNYGSGGWNIRNNSSVSRVFITDSGNVGIGTTGPSGELDIDASNAYADLFLDGTTGGQVIFQDDGVTEGYIWSNDNLYVRGQTGAIHFGSSGSDSQMVLSGGNVGIGTTGPGAKLQVGAPNANWYHIGGYNKTFAQAKAACEANGDRLAKYAEIVEAYKNGANSCSWGWIEERFIVFPMQDGAVPGCGGAIGGVRVSKPGLSATYGAYCARDVEIVKGTTNIGSIVTARGIKIEGGQSGDVVYFGHVDQGSNADTIRLGIGTTAPGYKLDVQAGQVNASGGLCIAGVCKTDWGSIGGTADNSKACSADGTCETTSILNSGGTINNPNSSYRWVGGGSWNTFFTPSGYIQLGPVNTSWAHIYTDRSKVIFNVPVYSVADAFSSYDADLQLQRIGSTKLTLTSSGATVSGNLTVAGNVVPSGGSMDLGASGNAWDKLYVGTIDPVYEIDGKKYATYVSDFAGGVRTETSGVLQLQTTDYKLPTNVVDFSNLEKGSDLWLFWQTSNQDMKDLVVILTPGFNGDVWYEKQDNKLIIYGDEAGEVSYRLTLPREDYENWGNLVDEVDE